MGVHRVVDLQRCVVSCWLKEVNLLEVLSFCKKSGFHFADFGEMENSKKGDKDSSAHSVNRILVSPAVCRIPS